MSKRRIRVYVAGAYDGPDVITVLANMRRGIHLSMQLLVRGYAPFCPWLDFQYGLIAAVPREMYLEYSMAWLEASDAVLLQPVGCEHSKGTQAELARAFELEIPVFDTLESLMERMPPWRSPERTISLRSEQ